MEARRLCPPETFSWWLITTKGSYWHIRIGDKNRGKIFERIANFRLLNRKAKI